MSPPLISNEEALNHHSIFFYNPKMYPFQQRDELSLQNGDDKDQVNGGVGSSSSSRVGSSMNYSSVRPPVHTNINGGRSGRLRRSSSLLSNHNRNRNRNNNNNDDIVSKGEDDHKKMIHRDIERHRRQEMSQLFASLHSILPPNYTKGRRSASDHLEEAVNYIKGLEKNVKELGDKRDHLKALAESTSSRSSLGDEGGSTSTCTPWSGGGSVVVFQREGGLDIEISHVNDQNGGGFCLSNALQVVFEEGLSVASCTSTNVNDRLLHQIVCEAGDDMTCIDVNRLHQRLDDLVG